MLAAQLETICNYSSCQMNHVNRNSWISWINRCGGLFILISDLISVLQKKMEKARFVKFVKWKREDILNKYLYSIKIFM